MWRCLAWSPAGFAHSACSFCLALPTLSRPRPCSSGRLQAATARIAPRNSVQRSPQTGKPRVGEAPRLSPGCCLTVLGWKRARGWCWSVQRGQCSCSCKAACPPLSRPPLSCHAPLLSALPAACLEGNCWHPLNRIQILVDSKTSSPPHSRSHTQTQIQTCPTCSVSAGLLPTVPKHDVLAGTGLLKSGRGVPLPPPSPSALLAAMALFDDATPDDTTSAPSTTSAPASSDPAPPQQPQPQLLPTGAGWPVMPIMTPDGLQAHAVQPSLVGAVDSRGMPGQGARMRASAGQVSNRQESAGAPTKSSPMCAAASLQLQTPRG